LSYCNDISDVESSCSGSDHDEKAPTEKNEKGDAQKSDNKEEALPEKLDATP